MTNKNIEKNKYLRIVIVFEGNGKPRHSRQSNSLANLETLANPASRRKKLELRQAQRLPEFQFYG